MNEDRQCLCNASDEGPNEFRNTLFMEGDFGEEVTGGDFTSGTMAVAIRNANTVSRGSVPLSGDGQVYRPAFSNGS